MLEILLDCLAKNNLSAFKMALSKFKPSALDIYITEDGETLLISIIRLSEKINDDKKYLPYIRELLNAGADVNKGIGGNNILSGGTALMCAIDSGLYNIANALIVAGADVDMQDDEGFTTLISVCGSRRYATIGRSNQYMSTERCIELILANTKNIDLSNNEGDTALHYAVVYNLSVAIKLLEKGAKVKHNSFQQSPMLFFAKRSTIGADGLLANFRRLGMPLDNDLLEIEKPQLEIESQLTCKLLELLLKAGDKVDNEDMYGRKPLIFAKKFDNQPFLQLISNTNDQHSYNDRQYYIYFEKVFALIKANLDLAESMNKRLVIIAGESHKEKRCLAAELIFLCVCHNLGIKNILLELDKSRSAECMLEIQSFAADLRLKLYFIDDIATTQTVYGINYEMSARNKHMYTSGQQIGDNQFWVLGAAHLAGVLELFTSNDSAHVVAVNLTPVKDLSRGQQILYMPFPDHEQFIGSAEELVDTVRDCYKTFNFKYASSRCKL